ncbi:hypothetical protein RF55_15488 [Lasius niger]|uniref:Uncharacterized protein n=1 Tax=Lasius niger TaxID=67767 RepID=A0A0J7K6F2_LASNI|nr:hypothetical protein RF55_15488 [Lasius niger]
MKINPSGKIVPRIPSYIILDLMLEEWDRQIYEDVSSSEEEMAVAVEEDPEEEVDVETVESQPPQPPQPPQPSQPPQPPQPLQPPQPPQQPPPQQQPQQSSLDEEDEGSSSDSAICVMGPRRYSWNENL